ncbi:hypothetical protein [Glaciimonas sp. PCH181]|uniref:hypothetical protein n=1 Tax=Glaciimonas sp. PCH181 TaxID=2133943 RepID=UPI001374EAAE|nr:hypothetical protein [Glaciimonas sp. PCH181]
MFVLHSVSPLDTSNTIHKTYITSQGLNKRGLEIGGGYIQSTWSDQIFNHGR